jgi:hypothetical protein
MLRQKKAVLGRIAENWNQDEIESIFSGFAVHSDAMYEYLGMAAHFGEMQKAFLCFECDNFSHFILHIALDAGRQPDVVHEVFYKHATVWIENRLAQHAVQSPEITNDIGRRFDKYGRLAAATPNALDSFWDCAMTLANWYGIDNMQHIFSGTDRSSEDRGGIVTRLKLSMRARAFATTTSKIVCLGLSNALHEQASGGTLSIRFDRAIRKARSQMEATPDTILKLLVDTEWRAFLAKAQELGMDEK